MKKSIILTLCICCYLLTANAATTSCNVCVTCDSSFSQDATLLAFRNWERYRERLPTGRTPSTYNLLPKAWIEGISLILCGTVTIENLHYDILDSEENILFSGYICAKKNAQVSVDLSSLSTGNYILQLTIGSDAYIADFEL